MLNPIADTASTSIENSSAWAEPFVRDNYKPCRAILLTASRQFTYLCAKGIRDVASGVFVAVLMAYGSVTPLVGSCWSPPSSLSPTP
jgi:hypothetical protein